MSQKIDNAMNYLITGGLGEVMGLASIAMQAGSEKVQIDSDMAVALCMLANEAIKKRAAH